jgi:hypothetical protein
LLASRVKKEKKYLLKSAGKFNIPLLNVNSRTLQKQWAKKILISIKGAKKLKMQNTIRKSARLKIYQQMVSATFHNSLGPQFSLIIFLYCERRRDFLGCLL